MDHLERAGLLKAVDAWGFQKKLGARFIHGEKTCVFDFGEQFTKGWTWTWQLPRADFDKVLADEAARQGVPISYATEVVDVQILESESLVRVRNSDGEEDIRTKYIIDCSGYGRVLPRFLNLDKPSTLPSKSAFFAHLHDSKRKNTVEDSQITVVVIKRDVWLWIIPFSNGITSLGFVGDPDFFNGLNGSGKDDFRELLSSEPNFADRFADEKFALTPKLIHAYSKSIEKLHGPGYVLAGNSAEFLDPIFSSGVAFATGSGLKAAELVSRSLDGETVDWQEEYEAPVRKGVAVFKSFVDGWYDGSLHKIFFSDYVNPDLKKQICSVLGGYVWDESNPVVQRHDKILKLLEKVIEINGGD